jgi:alkyldihydroxyacetonephosphate synthase
LAEAEDLARELEELLPGRVSTDVDGYLKDWWPFLNLSDQAFGSAVAAVKPSNVDELTRLMNFASSRGISLYVRGGGSSITGASIPSGGVVVDTTSLNQVLDIDEANRTVTAQSGVKLKALETKLNGSGYTLSQFPESFELATVGGFISTMGTGQYGTLYGGIENSVLRLEVVLPSGEVAWTRRRGAPRSSVGPDLSRIFLGAEGSLGIISAAELRIRKLPSHMWKGAFTFANFEDAVNSARALTELDVKPAVCRANNEVESQLQFNQKLCTLVLVYHFRSEEVMEAERKEIMALLEGSSTPADPRLVDLWWESRFNFKERIDSAKGLGYAMETIEVAAKWSRLLELYYDVVGSLGDLRGVGGVGACVPHLYEQGGSLSFTVLFEPKKEVYWKVWELVDKASRAHDATISHQHGVGILKKVYGKNEIPIDLLRRIKQAIDPEGILSPDRFPG